MPRTDYPLYRLRRLPDRKGWLRTKPTYELSITHSDGTSRHVRDGEGDRSALSELVRLTHVHDAHDYQRWADRCWDGGIGAWCAIYGPDLVWVAEAVDAVVVVLKRADASPRDWEGLDRTASRLRAVALAPPSERGARRRALSELLASLTGGMGSLQDLALPGPDGSYADMPELDALLEELFRRARLCLS